MTTTRTARHGRRRWGPLVRFLTEMMQTAQSEKVKMAAALRLADILSMREQREQLEMRRELRMLAKVGDEPNDAPEAPIKEERETVDAFLARIRAEQEGRMPVTAKETHD